MKESRFYRMWLLAALCAMSGLTHAQSYDNYSLKDYSLPDIRRNALDFTLSSDGGLDYMTKKDGWERQVNADLGALLDHWTYRRDFIGSHKLDFKFNGNMFKYYPAKDIERTQRILKIDINYDNHSQFYFSDSEKWFWMVGGNAGLHYNKIKDKGENEKSYTLNFSIQPKAGIGWGRMENVTDARQAVYILEKLEKKGVMSRHLTDDEVNEFAQVISTVKNKRFFDSRRHTIDEITTVTRYLEDKGYLNAQDLAYYTTLYDYWMYGALHQRLSGFQAEVEVQPGYRRQTMALPSNDYNSFLLNARANLQYEKPVNLYWQHSAAASFGYQYVSRKKTGVEYNEKYKDKISQLNLSYYLGYYPTSRTHLRLGVEEELEIKKPDQSDKTTFSATSLNCKGYYYLSPQLRLEFSANIGYQRDKKMFSGNRWCGGYSFTLTYSLY